MKRILFSAALSFISSVYSFGQTPTMNCPNDTTISTTPGECTAIVNYTVPTCATNCTGATITQTDATGLTSGDQFPIGTTTIEYTITNASGSNTCSFDVTIWDNQSPQFTNCNNDTTIINSAGMCGAIFNYTLPNGTDNCGATNLVQLDGSGLTPGSTFPAGTTTLSYRIDDQYGNQGDTCTWTVTVIDIEAPVIACPLDQDQVADNNCNIILADYTSVATTTDNCGAFTVVQGPAPGTLLSGSGSPYTITLTATDSSGNIASCQFSVNVKDTLDPYITCPGNQYVSSTGNCEAVLGDYTPQAIATDSCDAFLTITQVPAPGTIITTQQLVTLTATDDDGNSASCSFNVVVDDPIAPILTCPNDSTVYVDSICNFTIPDFSGSLVINDNCDQNPTIVQTPAIGTVISGPTQFISFDVTDAAGNNSVCSFLITLEDSTGPAITCPPNQSLYVDANCEALVQDYTGLTSGTDNCGGTVFITQSPSFNTTVIGDNSPIAITMTASDILGNTTTCEVDLVLIDTIKPVITQCQADTAITADTNCQYIVQNLTGNVITEDNCNSGITYSQVPSIGDTLLNGSSTTIWVYVSDASGNMDSCSFNLDVLDNTAPTLICLSNPLVVADSNCSYVVPNYDTIVAHFDNCDPTYTFTQSPAPGTILTGIGTTQAISIYVEDGSGNFTSCAFTITLQDTLTPTIECPGDQYIDIDNLCQYTLPDMSSLVTFNDLCDSDPTVWQSPGVGTLMTGINTVTMYVTDSSGNTNSCMVTTYPNDTVPPVIVCPQDTSNCSSIVNFYVPIGTDDCGIATTIQTDTSGLTSGDSFPVGTTTLTYEVYDEVNNMSTCSFDITIYAPVLVDAGTSVTIEEGDDLTLDATVTNASSIEWSPAWHMDNPNISNPTVSPNFTSVYTVEAISPDGCYDVDSVLILVNPIKELIINNFVSPNNDNKNDTWNLNKPSIISGCWVKIYNRWETLVWETNDYTNNWDGTNQNGEPLPEGTYFYIISCSDEEYKGTILLMR